MLSNSSERCGTPLHALLDAFRIDTSLQVDLLTEKVRARVSASHGKFGISGSSVV